MVTSTSKLLLSTCIVNIIAGGASALDQSDKCDVATTVPAQKLNVVLYPAASTEAITVQHALALPDDQLNKNETCCPICLGELVFGTDVVVAPHNGIHWMHLRCYFQLLSSNADKEAETTCPYCRENISAAFAAVLKPLCYRRSDDASADSTDTCALVMLPSASDLAAKDCALLKDALVVIRNILQIRKAYSYDGQIFSVDIDLSRLDSAEAIIARIVANTKCASILDVYLANLTPPTQAQGENCLLCRDCTDLLNEMADTPDDYGLSEVDWNIVRFVVTQLKFDRMCSRMARILDILGIVKEAADGRIMRKDLWVVITLEVEVTATVTGDLWIEDSYGKHKDLDRITIQITQLISATYNTDMMGMACPASTKEEMITRAKADLQRAAKAELIKQGRQRLQEKERLEECARQSPFSSTRRNAALDANRLYVSHMTAEYSPEIKWVYKNPPCLGDLFCFSDKIALLRRASDEEHSVYM